MSDSKHTPGPWRLYEAANTYYIHAEAGSYQREGQTCYYIGGLYDRDSFVADLIVTNQGPSGDANARLIAAAPELLEALQAVLAMADTTAPRKQDDAITWRENDDLARGKALAAIAKATGDNHE